MLDRQALGVVLGVVKPLLAKNVAYNVVNEKTTYGLINALSNMYEKPSASKVEQRQIEIKEERSVQEHAGYHVLELKQEGPLLESVFIACILQDKEVNMAARDSDDAFRFRLGSVKVRLADDKTLDIAGFGDVVLKTSFACGNKCGSMYMVEVPYDGINASIDGRGNTTLWHQRLAHMSEKGMKIPALKGRILDLQKAVVGFYEPCVLGKLRKVSFVKSGNTRKLQRLKQVYTYVYGPTSIASIGESRYYVTFIDDNIRKENMSIGAKRHGIGGVKEAYLVNRRPSVPLECQILKEEWQRKEVSLAHVKAMTQMRWDIAVRIRRVIRSSEVEMSHLMRTLYKEPRLIVAELGLSSKITQSTGGSSDTSEGSKTVGTSRIVKDHMKKTLKMEHPSRREAPRLHRYEAQETVVSRIQDEGFWLRKVDSRNEHHQKLKGTLRLSQEKYIGNVLEKFNIKDEEDRCWETSLSSVRNKHPRRRLLDEEWLRFLMLQ
nr:retrovirus-related Pol polyprotein from transposon TNT 1-94 [Tanacetum cinerariifolium]